MPSRPLLRIASSALALFASVPALQAIVPNRIGAIAETGRTPLTHTIPRAARRSADLGPARLDRVLPSVTLHFGVSPAQQAALNQLMIDQQDPGSPRFHQWLTPAQYGAQFGLSSSDLATVSAWLTGQGLKITAVSPSSNFIAVSGTVAQIQTALGTSIHQLSLNGEQHISNITDPVVPSALAGVLSGITGLNDFTLKPRAQSRTVVHPSFTSALSGNHYIAPGDFYAIYDVAPLLASSINGSGITIAVVGQTDIATSDVAAFRSASGLSASVPAVKLFGTDPGTLSADLPEAMLDVEWSGAVAPSASILYVNSKDVIGLSLINSITSNLAPIISISYGACEIDWGQRNLTTLNQYFQQANLQGQTIVGPAGDSGATDCDYQSTLAADGLAVDFPSSSPFVTAAGGTMFNDASGSFWSSTNGANSGSATGYIPEGVWNETSAGGLASTGGGASAFFSKPAWQVGAGVPSDLSRDVPDIALNSAFGHDGYLICQRGSCVNGYRAADGQTLTVVGGTSAAVPAFAGMLALVEQKTGSRLGNANPQIYGLANSTFYNNVFHDVTSGTNSSPCVQGSPNCPNGGSIGYSTNIGYDLATGWGSLDAYNLVNKWGLVPSSGLGSATGAVITSTVVTTSSPTCGISGGTLALSIAVANSINGSTVVPTRSVQILLDNAAVGSPLRLSNGAASYTLSTSALASGGHTVSAVYLGDGNFAGSKGSLLTDVVSSTQPDFSVTPCTSSATAPAGGTASSITFTARPFNGFTGPVAFTAIADATLSASYTFSVSPVTVTGSNGSSTVLTLSAFQTNSATSTGLVKISTNSTPPSAPPSMRSVYTAGSGAALASVLLLTLPRRRRWGALLAMVLSVGAIAASGCGSGGSLVSPGPVTPTPTTTAAAPGTYTVTVVGSGSTPNGNRIHSAQITFVVQ